MSTPMKTMGAGRTGFWMRVDSNLNVRVVNGTMFKLLSAKKGFTLTHILSRRIGLKILWSRLQQNHQSGLMDNNGYDEFPAFGLNGSRPHLRAVVWGLNTRSQWFRVQKVRRDTLRNIYSSQPFSLLSGLKDGSASDTVKDFHQRRNGKQTQ